MSFRSLRRPPPRAISPTHRAALCLVLAAALCRGTYGVARDQPPTGISALRHAQTWRLDHPTGFSFDATVTFVDAAAGWLVVQEGRSAAAIHARTDLSPLAAGDRVHLSASDVYVTIPSVPGFPFHPTRSEVVDTFAKGRTNQINYVDRYRGYLVPPRDGSYRFWLTSDDSSELWLSENDRPEGARKIATVPVWTETDEWSRFPSQQSAPIPLEAGKRYYIEVLHEQSDGGDHVAVAWERADLPRAVIGSQYLYPFIASRARTSGPPATGDAAEHGILREIWDASSIGTPADLQPVRASGTSFEAEHLTFAILGHRSMPPPLPIKVGEPIAADEGFRWAETNAEIRSVHRTGDRLDLELCANDRRMTAHVLSWAGATPTAFRGYLVHLVGACEQAFDAEGRSVPGALWIQGLDRLPVAGPSPTWSRVPSSEVSEIAQVDARSPNGVPVRVRGRVVARNSPCSFILEDEGSFAGYYSSDGKSWKQLGDEVHVPMRDPVSVGLAVTSHGGQTTIAKFDQVTGLGPGPQGDQIGGTSPTGDFTSHDGAYTITGVGNDIWDWQDEFYFVHGEQNGDGTLVAHVDSVGMHSVWAKAGLMMRESLAPDALFVDLVNVGGNRLSLQWRVNRPHRATEAVYTPADVAPSWLKLVRQHHRVAFTTLQPASPDGDQVVEVLGYLHRNDAGAEIEDAFIRPVPPPDSDGLGDEDRPLIEIRALPAGGHSTLPNYFRLRGVVTCNRASNNVHYFAVQDATAGTFLFLNNAVDQRTLQPGTLVDVYCDPITTGDTAEVLASKVVPLGPAAMPRPIAHPMELLGPAKVDGQWIEVDGIVYAARAGAATLRAAGSYVAVEASGMSTDDWSRLIDHRVRVQGVALDQHTSELKVMVPAASYVEESGSDLPEAILPARTLADLAAPKALPDPSHRVHVVGTITFVHGRLLILDDGTGTATVELNLGRETANVGDKVEVTGFPTIGPNGALTVIQASLRPLGAGTIPPPVRAAAAGVLDGKLGQRLVTVEAEVVDTAATDTGDIFDLESDGRRFRAWCPSHRPALESIRDGSRIRLTGFAYDGPAYVPADPLSTEDRQRSVHFIVRSPDDIVYLAAPPWLRLKRALYVLGALACALLLVVAWAQVLRRRVRQRTAQLTATLAKLREETALAATLTERQRLAGEIHDSLEQGISGIMLQLEGALQSPSCPPDLRETIGVARNMVSFSHAEIRHAIWDLHSPVLEGKTLPTALRQMPQLVGIQSPAVDVAVHGAPVSLPREIEHHLLRIAQEAVTNAVKHAHATKIQVELAYTPTTVELRVTDDGCGFSIETHRVDQTHFGLRSLRRRAKKMNATLNLKSAPQTGTVVEVVLPIPREVIT